MRSIAAVYANRGSPKRQASCTKGQCGSSPAAEQAPLVIRSWAPVKAKTPGHGAPVHHHLAMRDGGEKHIPAAPGRQQSTQTRSGMREAHAHRAPNQACPETPSRLTRSPPSKRCTAAIRSLPAPLPSLPVPLAIRHRSRAAAPREKQED
ncbi:hypothetical protein NDU88_006639 [Pleurodeles waltl]|uniref:Uncharacterized protein n=1 Tax=Pleurodeles waltl TaxID=8319 RepID=A0AAV7RQS1_PLEWA|nr:hypothetical protein NDU88_006639 [Pleurodeles waltl]